MYYGKKTKELMDLIDQYWDMFGYNPNGDMELELGDSDYDDYVEALKESIRTGKEIYETLEGADY